MFGSKELELLDSINRKLDIILRNSNLEIREMAQLDDQIAALQNEVTAETGIEQSAIVLLNGIPALIQTAIAQAQAAGATPAELQALSDLQTKLTTSSTALAAAVAANTPVTNNPTQVRTIPPQTPTLGQQAQDPPIPNRRS